VVELKYFDRLQDKIGKTHSSDRIDKVQWWEVVIRELNQMSSDYARELQLETGTGLVVQHNGIRF
jgi:hypothetical protein